MATKYKKYSAETKIKYAKMIANDEISVKEAARELDASTTVLRRWRDRYLEYGESYFFEEHRGKGNRKGKSGNPYAALHTSKKITRLEYLELENAKLKAENLKLKKEYMLKGVGAYRESVMNSEKRTKSSKK